MSIERPWSVRDIEPAIQRVEELSRKGSRRPGEIGLRAAADRSPLLLAALEAIAEELHAVAERQHGQTRRSADTAAGRAEVTLAALFRKAYELADKGTPEPGLMAQYGAAAVLARLV